MILIIVVMFYRIVCILITNPTITTTNKPTVDRRHGDERLFIV